MIRLVLVCTVLLLAGSASGQGRDPIDPSGHADNVIMKDTLVESRYTVEHIPLRAGGAAMYGMGWFSSGTIPAPLSQAGCDQFANGSGPIVGAKFLAEIPFWGDDSRWTFSPEIFFNAQRLQFFWTERSLSLDPDSVVVPFSIQHEIAATEDLAGFGARFNYRVAGAFDLHAGLEIGYGFHQTYERLLHMVEPGNSFLSNVRDTSIGAGALPDKPRFVPQFTFGAGYEVPLSRKLRAAPEVELTLPLLGMTPYWRGATVTGGVRLLFDLTPRYESVPVFVKHEVPVFLPRHVDTLPAQKPPLTASIEAVAVSKDGVESKVVTMMIEEVRTRNAYPILNYIFFDEGSSKLAKRYVTYRSPEVATSEFKGSGERSNTPLLDLYHETLNILGDRLRKFPKARVTLTGSTSNSGVESNNIALARARAEAIKSYLVSIWQIEPERITVRASVVPERPSPVTTAAGQEENRRVEFQVTDDRAFDPVLVTNLEHFASPDRIELKPSITTTAGIASTEASISAGHVVLQSFRNDSSTHKLWSPTESTLRNLEDSLSIDYHVTDSAGNSASAHSSIPLNVIRVTSDRQERVERFNLILFGFDESRIEKRNDREMESIAKLLPKISVNRMLVQGYTDETGDQAHNDALSQARASAVAVRLNEKLAKEQAVLPKNIVIEGRGAHDILYDNSLPEGRFFSRTVNVTIEKASVTHY